MDTMPGMLWTKERVEKWLREHGASGDVRLAVVLASDIVYDYEAALSNQYQRIERFVELVDQLERKLQEATEANTSCTIYIASQMERIDELEAQLAAATEANTSCTRYIADQEIRIANLEHLLGDEDDEDKPYYDTPGGF